ncbi:MAG: IS1182 family transposase [Acidobacteriaceae bacterium]|nr:IS1182 family transposase [Acidobacteriaceae bacterium]
MSLHPQSPRLLPAETARVARAAFPKGCLPMHMADALGPLFEDQQFAALFPKRGQPAEAPARLALATLLQFAEGLSDRQAAETVRGRIDWKYALALELTDPGFDHTVLSEFRSRLVEGKAELLLLDALLAHCRELGLLKKRGRQRTDSTHVLAAVRVLNRLERVGETLRAALNALAVVAPEWLQTFAPAEWYERYGARVENYDLPKTEQGRLTWAAVIGTDGRRLLHAIDRARDQSWLREVPAVKLLRRVWAEQYVEHEGQVRWRAAKDMPSPADLIASPYDAEARYSNKRSVEWVGYKVHLTETCDDERAPHLITNVETTPATTPDDNMLEPIHQSLEGRDLLPAEHLVDKGYTDSETLVESKQRYGVEIIGPVADDPSWQARSAEGFDKSQFQVDWERKVVTCPAGHQSISWLPSTYPQNGMTWEVRFSRKDCSPCAFRAQCTRAQVEPRLIALQERGHYEALQVRRQQQKTEEFQKRYAARAGVEGTHAQAIQRCGLRQCRYVGIAKVRLQHVLTAAALNLVRIADWWTGTKRAATRRSRFAALRPILA